LNLCPHRLDQFTIPKSAPHPFSKIPIDFFTIIL